MTQKPYRRCELSWPPSRAQWDALSDEIENIYRELKRLRGTADDAVTEHNILSATHLDSTTASEVDGDMISGQAGKWARLAKGNPGDVMQMVGGVPSWGVTPAHNLLSASHGDTTAAAVAKGAVVAGSATKWEKIAAGADGQVLTADAAQTNGVAWRTPSSGSVSVLTNGDGTNPEVVFDSFGDVVMTT